MGTDRRMDSSPHSRSHYTNHGCRCDTCTRRANLYHQAYKAGRRKVEYATKAEQAEVDAHLAYLFSRGMPASDIAAATGISCATLSRIRNGKQARIQRSTARRILAVGLHLSRRP